MERILRIKFPILLIIITALLQKHGYKACLVKERIALLEIKAFFESVSGSTVEILKSWVDDDPFSDCCDWERVKCNATTQRVIKLSLDNTRIFSYNASQIYPSFNLSIFLPFQELQSLDISGNFLDGWNEYKGNESFESLKQLKILNLAVNSFNDNIFSYLNTITSLATLNLGFNRIEGLKSWRAGLANLRNLKVLDLSNNGISGSVTSLGLENLKNLEVLDLSVNTISGSIIGLAPNLKVLGLRNAINGYLESTGVCELKNLIELDLSKNNLGGHLPWCLNSLNQLKVLDISSNQFSGNLPSVIANLTSLEVLALLDNNFQGTFSLSSLANHSNLKVLLINNELILETENWVPKFQLKILQLPNCNLNAIPSFLLYQYDLKFLDLSNNKLAGSFPSWLLQNNTKLEVLHLRNNSFTGILQLPQTKHDFLRHLDISINNFTGKLPRNMGIILQSLLYLDISKNHFEGNIPYSLGEMQELRLLDLSRNSFSGELSSTSINGCFSLELLDVSENNFYGEIFPKYMNLTKLLFLYLNNNNFTGKLMDGLLNSNRLYVLDISNNMLCGDIPSWIGSFAYLRLLFMSKNLFEGNLPVQAKNFRQLFILDLSENRLSGSIPSSLNLLSLKHLYLQNNSLSGEIPEALFRSSTLMTLDLRDNKFLGKIPPHINELSDLRALLLRGNELEGHIPVELCQLQKLGIMDLSHNKLNGSIPSCFPNMLFWKEGNGYLYGSQLDYNVQYEGLGSTGIYYNSTLRSWPSVEDYTILDKRVNVEFVSKNRYEFYNGSSLNYMTGIDLSCNELTGEIPSEIGELRKVRGLNLSHNSLSGFIPERFSNLEMIDSLDLSYNELSGQIPHQLTQLNTLAVFNVSYNNLFGPVPDEGQFATFGESSYRGNPDLCGPLINKSCNNTVPPPNEAKDQDESTIDTVALHWSFISSYVTMILLLSLTLLINSHWRKLWFCFVDGCIDSCFYWLFKYVFH